jgi:hypothetical protein
MAKKLATMNEIYKRIRALREANDDTKEEHESRSEWQFAAIVVDRLCLIFFTFLFLCTGATMLVRAPYLVA